MFKRNKYRRYKMKFKKEYQSAGYGYYAEVTDNHLLSVLLKLQKTMDFEIVRYNFKNFVHYSTITIKCRKEDKKDIFLMYYLLLGDAICDIHM